MYVRVGTSWFVSQLSPMTSSCAKLSVKDPSTVLTAIVIVVNWYAPCVMWPKCQHFSFKTYPLLVWWVGTKCAHS